MVSGDLRPPLVQEAFNKRVIYTWDETDFGMSSVYQSRILIPSYFFVTVFQNLGMDLFSSQLAAVVLMYFIASVLMYVYVKQLTNGDIVAAFVAALFLTSNILLVSDREQSAIGFIDVILMILPSVVAFTEGIRKKSYAMLTLSGLLFVLSYGTFPNYRVILLCSATLVLTLLFMYLNNGLDVYFEKNQTSIFNASMNIDLMRKYLKYLAVFVVAVFLASGWIIVVISANFGNFLTTYEQTAAPASLPNYIKFHDTLRLIAKWSFYSGAFGKPFVPYADAYLHNPLLIGLSFFVPILAFASVLAHKSRKLAVYFSGIALFALILVSAGASELYSAFASYIPLMMVFREPAQWLFFATLAYGILIGIVSSALYHRLRKKVWQIITLCLISIILFSSSYPLITGDVTRNWLDTDIRGSFFPNSYAELNNALSDKYWALLLPQRYTYIVYNFTEGPLSSGNPYPLVFSKPIISGLGTEYTQSENLDLLNKVYDSMLTSRYENVAPQGNASGSSVEKDALVPAQAIDGDPNTRWASEQAMPQWLEIEWNKTQELSKIRIVFENAYANDYTIETWEGTNWTTQIKVENNTSIEPEYVFSQLAPTMKLRINFTKASPFNMTSLWELEAYAQIQRVPEFLGMLGIKYLILEKNLASGSKYDVSKLRLIQTGNFILAKEWDEVALYNNTYALQKLYTADSILDYTTLDDMFQTVEESEWTTLQHSALINLTSANIAENNTLVPPKKLVWSELSPTNYIAQVESKGPFVLVLLESYDEHWKVSVNGNPIQEKNHQEVNAFANGWLINSTGNLTISIQYETQNVFIIATVASLVLPFLMLTFLNRKDLKRIASLVRLRLKYMKVKSKQEM
jgi:hypothetical protein